MGDGLEVIQIIHTRLETRGDGKITVFRIIDQYWNMDGRLMWEHDPCAGDDLVKP